jgi:two-component system, NarL family, response regulator DevR
LIRLVIVDDHEMVRAGLRTMLDPEPDFEIVGESGSADELGELVRSTHPDVVLLDARLPGIGGAEATRRLAATQPDVKVLIVSTYDDDQLIDACLEAGARGYVIKDIENLSLKQSIRAVHSGEAVLSPSVARRVLERIRQPDDRDGQPLLNKSQLEILRLMGEGFSNREIAAKVHLSENTVKTHVQEIFRKLEVRNRVEAAIRAHREGWI